MTSQNALLLAESPELTDTDTVRALVVDDNPLFAEALTALLQLDRRIRVVGQARDGHEAVRLTALLQPDVVLMDLNMPGMDGFEATRRIRSSFPSADVVIVTASDSKADLERARHSGVAGFVTKDRLGIDLAAVILNVFAVRQGGFAGVAMRRGP